MVALLEARLHLYRGERARRAPSLARIRAREAEARAQGEADALMVPSEEVLCSMLELATRDASDDAWDELEARAERFSQGNEQIEVIETRAMWMAQRGRRQEARRHLERALDLASRVPNALGPRLGRRLHELG